MRYTKESRLQSTCPRNQPRPMRHRVYRNQLFIGLLGRFIVAPRLSNLFRLLSLAPFAIFAQTIIYPDSHH
jgi:hypothetical protein